MQKIVINLTADIFNGADFKQYWNCPIARAVNIHFGVSNASAGLVEVSYTPNGKHKESFFINHSGGTGYFSHTFEEDYKMAATSMFDKNKVIRVITLEQGGIL